ncbi:MAG TPA: hypothetical protein VN976_22145 [Verrucomicrobiae bacterium]|nr:hypothetical protein [Verrucomicrobiae bacterium]
MIEALRKLLIIRELLADISSDLDCDFVEQTPEIEQMQKLERSLFKKIKEWNE